MKKINEIGDQSAFSTYYAVDMERIIKKVLEKKKLIPALEDHSRKRIPFASNIMEKPLLKKFKIPLMNACLEKGRSS